MTDDGRNPPIFPEYEEPRHCACPHLNAFRGLALEALTAWEAGSQQLLTEAMQKIRKATR